MSLSDTAKHKLMYQELCARICTCTYMAMFAQAFIALCVCVCFCVDAFVFLLDNLLTPLPYRGRGANR